MKPAQILISFARQREKAYQAYGLCEDRKAKSIAKIKRVSGFFLQSDKKGWIKQIESEIREILPTDDSQFQKSKERVLQLLNEIST
ncbi:hypothetical protein [Pleomorphovibrio marinus]|uniref:hypothetical protein n=1 Tax=Pleomorphovibrio marinus TaxID=2164132 RepID=UPI000E0BBAA4|nr:hypothetical protein [Pleomorphovibrio marinus]